MYEKTKENLIQRGKKRADWIVHNNSPEKKESKPDNEFGIWYMEGGFSTKKAKEQRNLELDKINESNLSEAEKWDKLRQAVDSNLIQQNEELSAHCETFETLKGIQKKRSKEVAKDGEKRPFLIRKMEPSDVVSELKALYENNQEFNLPEMLVVRCDKKFYEQEIGSGLIESIRQEIHKLIEQKKLSDKENLLQPIIVAVADNRESLVEDTENSTPKKVVVKNERIKEIFIEQGANLIMDELDVKDLEQLAQLAAKIKADPVSMAPEKLTELKSKFYKGVAVDGRMEARSEITSSTQQELKILNEIIKQDNIKNILDVGCGSARITDELAKNENLILIGMDKVDELLRQAREKLQGKDNVNYVEGDLNDYTKNKEIKHGSQDVVIYTWNTILEALGPGNLLKTLNSAWLALKKDGVLVFDMPTRENEWLEDGWYHNVVDENLDYWSYIMTDQEIKFMLKIAGFDEESIEIKRWEIESNQEYPQGIKKITVTAKKI